MFEEEPAKLPCERHRMAGRAHDDGCYACQSKHERAIEEWKKRLLVALRVVTVESIFIQEPA